MKLNNKGFAISTVMYMILILAIILILATLSILGSRKLIIDKAKDEALNVIYSNEIKLPSGYQQLEYIESTGLEYIDTNFLPNQDTRVIVDFRYVKIINSFLFGTRDGSSTNAYSVNIGNSAASAYTAYGSSGNITYADPDTYRHVIDKNKNLLYVDGKLLKTIDEQTFSSKGSLEIFAAYSAGTKGYLPSIARIYSFKIYDNDVLIRDFIPCYRKADGIAGLYDIINNLFYTNASDSGEFVKGNKI